MIGVLIAFAAVMAGPVPGEVRTFRDWAVGCDNGRACQAVSQLPGTIVSRPGTIALSRGAAPDAPIVIRARAYESEVPPVSLAVDGKRVATIRQVGDGLYGPSPDVSPEMIAALLNGSEANLLDPAGEIQGRVSLAGLAAAARYMDDQQKRAGTITALAARGTAGAGTVPPPPVLPEIPVATVVDDAPAAPAALVRRLTAGMGCENETPDSETHRLDPRSVLILVTCWNGAYNLDGIAFVAAKSDLTDATPARFDYDARSGPDSRPGQVFGGFWDGDAGQLRAIAEGRGLGDCGTQADWAWDGGRFRLAELRTMPDCRGAIDWIPVWRARVSK